jgi:hypothetical protein
LVRHHAKPWVLVMLEFAQGRPALSLRDMHAAAIVAGLKRSERGALNVLALEGNPGIGKTTAIRRSPQPEVGRVPLPVREPAGCHQPRRDGKLGARRGRPADRHPDTHHERPNHRLRERWHAKQVELGRATKREVSCAVVADGSETVKPVNSPLLVLNPKEEEDIDAEHAAAKVRKDQLSEHEDLVQDRPLMGVLKGMALTAKELLHLNPEVTRMVLTAALQGFRERANRTTTIEALSSLFVNPASKAAGREERRLFAKKMPTIVVMVDELAATVRTPFVHAVAEWLNNEFLALFEDAGEHSPFSVTLVVSDASLGQRGRLERYLNAGDSTPTRCWCPSPRASGHFASRSPMRIAERERKTLHVMTNSFPASELHPLPGEDDGTAVGGVEAYPGEMQSPREAIRDQAGDAMKRSAADEVLKALAAGARQVIYFAQDKLFLRDLRAMLLEEAPEELHPDSIHVL